MITTITLNPSIDISYSLDKLRLNTVNRVTTVRKTAGGKGLNVARVLHQLSAKPCASGLIGGSLGEEIEKSLEAAGITHSFSKISGETRNCIAVLHEGKQTEILEAGPMISSIEAKAFLKHFRTLVEKSSLLTFSGSLPAGLPTDFYAHMIEICQSKNKPVVLDCSGVALKAVLESSHKPLLIKPNMEELADLLDGKRIEKIEDLKIALTDKLFSGIEWLVVSMGSQGAFAKHKDCFYRVKIPKIAVVNPVGSGDATLAGLAYSLDRNKSDETVLKAANALGMSNAQEAETGHVNLANYQKFFDTIKVESV